MLNRLREWARKGSVLLFLLLVLAPLGTTSATAQDTDAAPPPPSEDREVSEQTPASVELGLPGGEDELPSDEEGEEVLPEGLLEAPVLDEPPLELLLFDEEDLVAGASRKTSRLSEAPGTITLLQEEDMDALGVLTLGDLLRYLNSIQLVPGTVDGAVLFRGVRQPFNNKILLLRDGRVLNSPFRGDFSLDLSQPLDDVKRVEVVRGPGSALYGANAFAGFINLVTHSGEDLDGVQSSSAFGGDGLWVQSVLAGGKKEGIDWTLNARLAGSEGQDPVNEGDGNDDHGSSLLRGRVSGDSWFVDIGYLEVEAGSPGTFAFPTSKDTYDIRRLTLDGKKTWDLGDRFKLSVRAFYSGADNTYRFVSLALPECDDGKPFCDVDSDIYPSVVDVVDMDGNRLPEEVRRRYNIGFNSPPVLRQKAEAGDPDVYISQDAYEAWRDGTLGDQVEVQESSERRVFTEFQFDWKIAESNYLLMGGGIQADILRNSDVGDHTFRNLHAFVEDEQRFFGDRLIASASLRWDQHSTFGTTTSPRVSLIWLPRIGSPAERLVGSRTPFWLKAAFGKAFRSPNFVELFGETRIGPESELFGRNDPGLAFLQGNPDLEQESIETLELQAHWEPTRTFETTLTLFDYAIEDEVILNIDRDVVFALQDNTLIPVPGLKQLAFDPELASVPTSARFINIEDGTRGEGLEWSFSWSPRERLEGFTLWGNYSRMRIDRPLQEQVPFRVSEGSGNLLQVPFGEGLERESGLLDGFNLGALYRHPRSGWMVHYRNRLVGRLGDSVFSAGGRLVHDLTLGLDRGPFTARLTALNLTGEDWIVDSEDGTRPDLEARWHLILGWRWEF